MPSELVERLHRVADEAWAVAKTVGPGDEARRLKEQVNAPLYDLADRIEELEGAIRDSLCDNIACASCVHLRAALNPNREETSDG